MVADVGLGGVDIREWPIAIWLLGATVTVWRTVLGEVSSAVVDLDDRR